MFNLDPFTLLDDLKMAPEQLEERRNYIGASESVIITSGDSAKINNLARIKRGLVQPEDLSDVLPVQMGSFTEALNIAWFMKKSGRTVHSLQKKYVSAAFPFMRATLDGETTTERGEEATIQCKHVNPFKKLDEVILHYMPQLQHEMYCANKNWCIFSALIGNLGFEYREIERDDWYIAQLIEQERLFWAAVQDGRDPELVPPTAPSGSKPIFHKSYDFTTNNAWADAANDWLESRPMAYTFDQAANSLKACLPVDALTVSGCGVIATRAKNGAITIKPYNKEVE